MKTSTFSLRRQAAMFGICFAGMAAALLQSIAQPLNVFNSLKVLEAIMCYILLSSVLGGCSAFVYMRANEVYKERAGRNFSAIHFFIAILISVALSFSVISYIRVNSDIHSCDLCGEHIASIKYETGRSICTVCLANGARDEMVGYCEHCNTAFDTRNMVGGLCHDCFTDFICDYYG